MSMLLQTELAAETHLAEGLTLKLRCTDNNNNKSKKVFNKKTLFKLCI
jgi:hypothetical protein